MRSLMIVTFAALSVRCEAVLEFHQLEKGAYVLGHKEVEKPRVLLQPEGGERPIVSFIQGQGDEENGSTRSNNISQGSIGLWDHMLAYYNPQIPPVPNEVVFQDIPFQGTARTRISFIRATQKSGQPATARILAGGVGTNFVTIRLTSAKGSGFQYYIDIWGREMRPGSHE